MPSTRSSSIKSIIRIIHPGSSAKAKRQQVVVFPTNVVVPHVATCETQQRPFSFVTPKEFCNKSARSGHASFGPRSLSRQLRCRSAQPTINAVAADPLIKARFAGLGVDPMSRRPRSEAHCRRNREVGQHHPASTSRQSEAESPFRECVPMTVMGHLRHFWPVRRIAAWSREALHKAERYGIGHNNEDNRNGGLPISGLRLLAARRQLRTYSSLSEIAFAITGTKWNGPRFFGLRSPSSKSEAEPRADDW